MSLAAEAFALVETLGQIRSSALAEKLGCTSDNVHELLLPYVARGDLVSCDVQVHGEHLKDYRLALARGGDMPEFKGTAGRPRSATPAPEKREIPFGRPPAALAARNPNPPADQPKEAAPMTVADQCEAAFRKHGPMTTRQIREHVHESAVSTIVAQYARSGRFGVVGGSKGNLIYGLPDQELPKAQTGKDTPPRSLHKKRSGGGKPMPRKAKEKRKGAAARKAWKTRRAAEAAQAVGTGGTGVTFRPAITHDGALTLAGAARAGELNSAELRVLAAFLRRIDETGMRA